MGWADYRLTAYSEIEKLWETVYSAYLYLMVSLQSDVFQDLDKEQSQVKPNPVLEKFCQHPGWDSEQGWKNVLNNLRLIIQPYVFFCLIIPWLKVFPISYLRRGFLALINLMNEFNAYLPDG